MHPSDPDTTHAGAFFALDGGAPCPDPGDTLAAGVTGRPQFTDDELSREDSAAILASLRDGAARPTLQPRRIETSDPPPPQSAAEAGRHCLNLIESAVPEGVAADVWAAVEAYAAAVKAETREQLIDLLEKRRKQVLAHPNDPSWTEHFAELQVAVQSLPLGDAPR